MLGVFSYDLLCWFSCRAFLRDSKTATRASVDLFSAGDWEYDVREKSIRLSTNVGKSIRSKMLR